MSSDPRTVYEKAWDGDMTWTQALKAEDKQKPSTIEGRCAVKHLDKTVKICERNREEAGKVNRRGIRVALNRIERRIKRARRHLTRHA